MPAPFLKILSIGKSQQQPASPAPPPAPASPPFPFGEVPAAEKVSPPPAAILPPATSLLPPQAPPTPAPVANPPPAVPAGAPADPSIIRLSLVSALKNCTAQELGINPELIPSWIQVSLPLAAIGQQLATGRVRVGLSLIIEGLEAGYRSVLANARPGIEIELPATEVFHALPAGVTPPAVAPTPTPEPPSKAPEPFDPFTSVSIPAPIQPEVKPSSFADPFTAVSAPAEPRPSSDWSHQPAPEQPKATPPAPIMAEASMPTPVRTVSRDYNRDMLLRALLQFSGDLDTANVVRLTAQQPGISAVVCLLDGQEVSSAGEATSDADKFRRQAAKLLNHLQPIIALTGIEGTETFSMKSDAHIVTFSFQGATTLCVLHEPSGADRGLPEKITLISRELAQMLKDSPPFA